MKFRCFILALVANLFVFGAVAHAATFETDFTTGLIKRYSISTEHFRFEISPLIREQIDSDGDDFADVLEIVAEAAENSWDVEVGDLGYDEPVSGGEKIMVIFDDTDEFLPAGSIGVTGFLSNGDVYIAVDPWLSEGYLKITVAHELFHTIQIGYDPGFMMTNQGINWAEATAVWVQDVVYNNVNEYLAYLDDFFDYPDYSIFASLTPPDTLFEYALNVWPTFLTEYVGDDDIIREIWENYSGSHVPYNDQVKIRDIVTDAVDFYGYDLPEVFREFTLWNMSSEEYSEGEDFPSVTALEGVEDVYHDINSSFAPALYGTNYLYFENFGHDGDFYFHLAKPDGVSFELTLVPYDNESAILEDAVTVFVDKDDEMTSALSLSGLSRVDAVVVVVSPIEDEGADSETMFDMGYLYSYLANFGENIDDSIIVETTTSESSGKEGESGGFIDTGNGNGLTLQVMNYDENSVSFSWNRVNDDAVVGYQLYYWWLDDDGVYSMDYKEIDKPYMTYMTVADLSENVNYEFELYAVDEDGIQVGDASNTIIVTLEQWLYTDLSFMDSHYDSIAGLTDLGIFNGYPDGSFKPTATINRAELLKVLIEGRGITPDDVRYRNCFDDVRMDWYAKYVCYAKSQGWVQGYADGNFRPEKTIDKLEALKILFNVYEAGLVQGQRVDSLPYTDLSVRQWYSIYVWEASQLGILEEEPDNAFGPNDGRTRGEMAEELYRYLVVMGMI